MEHKYVFTNKCIKINLQTLHKTAQQLVRIALFGKRNYWKRKRWCYRTITDSLDVFADCYYYYYFFFFFYVTHVHTVRSERKPLSVSSVINWKATIKTDFCVYMLKTLLTCCRIYPGIVLNICTNSSKNYSYEVVSDILVEKWLSIQPCSYSTNYFPIEIWF